MREPLPVRTERLLLRRFRPDDKPALDRYRRHPDVARFQSWEADYPDDATVVFLERMVSAPFWSPGEWFQVAIELPGSGLVGDVAVLAGFDEARIGYSLHPDAWGHGYATEAITAVLGLLPLDDLGAVTATIDPRNERSRRVLQRLGFEPAGYVEHEELWRRSTSGATRRPAGPSTTG